MKDLIKDIIKPENDIETAIANDVDFIAGCSHGKPRKGHPEGKVIYHVQEVLENIDKFYGEDDYRSDLRLIALVHDSFKHKVDRNRPMVGENHHGKIASNFASKYVDDEKILRIIELHDEAYNSWRMGMRNRWKDALKRANRLIKTLLDDDTLDLYLKFYHCDNLTGNKSNDDFEWFEELTFNV